jgi:hypothetical protein
VISPVQLVIRNVKEAPDWDLVPAGHVLMAIYRVHAQSTSEEAEGANVAQMVTSRSDRRLRRLRRASVGLCVALGSGAVLFAVSARSPFGSVSPVPKAGSTSSFPSLTRSGSGQEPTRVCGEASVLEGPKIRPRRAVRVPAGRDNPAKLGKARTVYWFAPGVHTLGTGQFDQIIPGNFSSYIGAPGAILTGQDVNYFAFTQHAVGVTIENLTIENFRPPGNEGAVNASASGHWRVLRDTIQNNSPGTGMYIGTDDVVEHDCLTQNGQAGFGTFTAVDKSPLTGGPSNITLADNEISYNDTCNWEAVTPDPVPVSHIPADCGNAGEAPGCGCSGGGKFWEVDGATVTGNYVHNNFNVGLWADTNNTGLNFSDNYFASNWNEGLMYELSYNALIDANTFVGNGWGFGPTNPGFPTGAIYISESGGDTRVPGAYEGELLIEDNVFVNNWSGVVLWENSNRFCGSPGEVAAGICTLIDRSVANVRTCTSSHLTGATPADHPDYYDLCRWKTQNVKVLDNVFSFQPSDVPKCAGAKDSCGENAVFSEWGTYPTWSPYQRTRVEQAITFDQHNDFSDNDYLGPWKFMAFDQAAVVSFSVWHSKYRQDSGSKL